MLHVPLHRVWTPIQMIHYSTIEWKHNLLSIMQSQMQIMSITDLGAHRAHGSILGAAAAGEAPVPDPLPPINRPDEPGDASHSTPTLSTASLSISYRQ